MRTGVIAGLLFLSLAVPIAFPQSLAIAATEQNPICDGQPLDKPVPVPKDVATLLMNSPEGKEALGDSSHSAIPDTTAEMFEGSEVHLSGSREAELVVIGSYPMSGADNAWFWVVGSLGGKPKILLWAGGYCFSVLRTRTLGYKDIQIVWSSPNETSTTLYKFHGTRYKKSRERWKANHR